MSSSERQSLPPQDRQGRTTPRPSAAASARRPAEQAVLALQRKAGNRAVTGALRGGRGPVVVQRQPRGGSGASGGRLGAGWERMAHVVYSVSDTYEALRSAIPPYPKGGDVRAALAAGRPGLLGVLTEAELDQWQRAVDRAAAERELGRFVDALVTKSGSPLKQQDAYKAWRRRADAALPPPGPEGGVLQIETGRFLHPDIMKIDFDVEAKKAFRLWAIQRLYADGITLRLVDPDVDDLRFAQQMLPTEGRITAESLISIFPTEYRKRVSERPMLVQLRQLAGELQTIHAEVDPEFQNRVELNEKYSGALAFVRKWSEWLGKGDAEMPDVAQWNGAYYLSLKPGAQFLQEGKFELAVPLLRQAYDRIPALAEQFGKYDYRYRTGALSSIKWLGRIKLAGSIAMMVLAGPEAGIWEAAGYAGAYAGAQNLAQQGMEEHLGQRSSIDLGAVAKDAAMASTMALIGMPLQAKMQGRILEAFVGGKALEEGVTATVLEKGLSNALAGMLSEVYLVPTQLVMGRVVSGQAFPSSVEELCGMIVDQALTSAVVTTVTDKLNAEVAKIRAERAAAGGADQAVPTALGPRRSQEIGGNLLALGEKLATTGADPAAVKAASVDPVFGPKGDPALKPDPATEFGLSSPDAVKRVAEGVYKVSGEPVMSKQDKYGRPLTGAARNLAVIDIVAEKIMAVVAKELPQGMPLPKIKVGHDMDPDRLGSYDPKTNTIFVNADAQARVGHATEVAFDPTSEGGYKRLLGLVYHEARHAEQTFLALRVEAGRLARVNANAVRPRHVPAGEEIARTRNVDAALAKAAAKQPIHANDTSPEARLGRDLFEETFGSGSRRADRDFAQATMGQHHRLTERLKRLGQQIGDLRKVLEQAGHKGSDQLADLVEQADHTRLDLERANDIYWKLAEEIDARRAGFSAEAAFQRILDAQLLLGMAASRIKTAEGKLRNIQGLDEKEIQKWKAVLLAAQQEHDELQRLAALLPTPAGSTK
jgi:hypothetical protein